VISLGAILANALDDGKVAHNVVREQTCQKRRQRGQEKRNKRSLKVGRDVPSKDEIQVLLAKVEGRWRSFFVTAIFTGMRASELRGLTWEDVDFQRRIVHVRQRANLWGEIGFPKSEAGHREIPMALLVVNALREWKLQCSKGELGLVFPNGAGNVENHANILNRGFNPLQREAGIVDAAAQPKYGLHALRHFFASLVIEWGFPPKRLQALLRHSSIQMTFDRYGHLFPSLEDDHAKFAAGEWGWSGENASLPKSDSREVQIRVMRNGGGRGDLG
jgi:integrase